MSNYRAHMERRAYKENMRIVEIGPDDSEAVASYAGLVNASHHAHAPWMQPLTAARAAAEQRYGWDGDLPRRLLGYDDAGDPACLGEVAFSTRENLRSAFFDIRVRPDRVRQGLGSEMLAHLERLSLEIGRPLTGLFGLDSPAARGFAEAHGYPLASADIIRRMVPGRTSPQTLAELRAEAEERAGDYVLEEIAGCCSPAQRAEIAEVTAAINDAPTDDLEWEDEVFDPERIAAYETAQVAGGMRLYRVVARHRGSGEIGGHTVVVVDTEAPEWAYQHDTAVVRDHRGHRLGLLLKCAMVEWMGRVEPQIRSIDTWNAESNDHMIAVNEQLGYDVMGRELVFQRHLPSG